MNDEGIVLFIAEDDPLMARLYEKAFRFNHYAVEMAFDGEEALNKLKSFKDQNKRPTIVLLDIMMPKLSGFDVLKFMKEDAGLKDIPVVVLTNLAGQEDAEKALSMGAVLYLVKSQYDPKQVVEKIKEVVSGYSRKSNIPEVKVQVKDIEKK